MKKFKNLVLISLFIVVVSCSENQKKTSIVGDSLELPAFVNSKISASANLSSTENTNLFSNSIDYRKFQTKVKNQGTRGTCTAFSVASTLEILPGVPANVSEQYIYGALKHSQPGVKYKEGDFLRNYVKSLNEYGFIHEEKLPYQKEKIAWEESDTDFSKILKGTQLGKVSLHMLKYYAKYSITNNKQFRYYDYKSASNIENIKTLVKPRSKVYCSSLQQYTWSNLGKR